MRKKTTRKKRVPKKGKVMGDRSKRPKAPLTGENSRSVGDLFREGRSGSAVHPAGAGPKKRK